METLDATRRSYEALPYERLVHRFSHPDRIAVAARLAGHAPPPVATARVLELGCASGDNLVGMAFGLPAATFSGVDLSERQIGEGRRRVAELGLANVDLDVGDLRDLDGARGAYDYVVAHGVLSWVGEPVRRRLLEVCRERLAPRGVAFVSWNALPGWRFRRLVRDVLLAGATGAEAPGERVRRARERLALVAANVFEPEGPWGRYLAERAEEVAGESDAYVLHDFLEPENEAFSIRDVAARAREAGLDYLCDAQEPWVPEEPLSPELRRALDAIPDPLEREELLDVLRERSLRQGLFVRADRPASAAAGDPLHAAARPDPGVPGPGATAPGPAASGSEAVPAAALAALCAAWPATRPVSQLARGATEELVRVLARLQREGRAELRTVPLSCGAPLSERPRASELARLQAAEGSCVTSLRHRNVTLDPLAVEVLRLLDGRRTVEEVAAACGWPAGLVSPVVGRLLADSLLEG